MVIGVKNPPLPTGVKNHPQPTGIKNNPMVIGIKKRCRRKITPCIPPRFAASCHYAEGISPTAGKGSAQMEIDITDFVTNAETWDFSGSVATHGPNAGPNTWANAKRETASSPLLT